MFFSFLFVLLSSTHINRSSPPQANPIQEAAAFDQSAALLSKICIYQPQIDSGGRE